MQHHYSIGYWGFAKVKGQGVVFGLNTLTGKINSLLWRGESLYVETMDQWSDGYFLYEFKRPVRERKCFIFRFARS